MDAEIMDFLQLVESASREPKSKPIQSEEGEEDGVQHLAADHEEPSVGLSGSELAKRATRGRGGALSTSATERDLVVVEGVRTSEAGEVPGSSTSSPTRNDSEVANQKRCAWRP